MEGDVVGGDLKNMRDYTKKLHAEGEQWKKFISERKEMYRNAKKNAKLVEAGQLTVGEEQKWKLSSEDRMRLEKRAEKMKAASSQLQSASSDPSVQLLLKDISNSCVRTEAKQDEVSERLRTKVRLLNDRADSLANKV